MDLPRWGLAPSEAVYRVEEFGMSRTYPPEDRQLACLGAVPAHLRPVLAELLAGATDAVASRRMNVSERTYSRRLAELLDFFGSQTRFQIGVQVGLSGWTTGSRPADISSPSWGLVAGSSSVRS
jgi:hypothetical protein